MYSHPDINYKPQHPMLKNQRGYTVEDEGVLDSIKSSLPADASLELSDHGCGLRQFECDERCQRVEDVTKDLCAKKLASVK